MNKTIYLTTTIPYVNAKPHIGFALELVQADVLARWHRSQGHAVRLQTGSDENSLKNVQAAEQAGRPVADFVADNAARFLDLQSALNISADDFIRTSSDIRHRRAVEAIWRKCAERGDLYRKSYTGLYCTGCEQFYAEGDLVYGCCPEHGLPPEPVTETNWFFRLSRYQDEIQRLVESDEIKITPSTKKNEVLSLIKGGLQDFSVSRSSERARGWGIPVPDDPSETIYVWFDALGNYCSALGYGSDSDDLKAWWINADAREHLLGKGVTRFHAVYWPAILLSIGLPLPTAIHVHGYVTVGGQKIGKSNGNAIDPVPLIEKYGADAVRYYLLRHITATDDGDFTVERLERAYSSELAGQLGNLVTRVLSIVRKQGIDVTPYIAAEDNEFTASIRNEVSESTASIAFHDALAAIFRLVAYANKAVADTAPWALSKAVSVSASVEALDGYKACLARLLGLIGEIARLLYPYLPHTARKIEALLDEPASNLTDLILFPKLASQPHEAA